jgi:hypothetical protein
MTTYAITVTFFMQEYGDNTSDVIKTLEDKLAEGFNNCIYVPKYEVAEVETINE